MLGLIIGAVALLFTGFGGGWLIKDWKDGAQIAIIKSEKRDLESRNAILETANTSCATDIEGVRKGVAVVIDQVEERERAASAAMQAADVLVVARKKQIAAIKNLPPVPPEPEGQCAAIVGEQEEYVQARTQSIRK